MPKTYIAQGIADIREVRFIVTASGNLIKIEVAVEVNYGEFGKTERVDLFPDLTATEKQAAQSIYTRIKGLLEAKFLL